MILNSINGKKRPSSSATRKTMTIILTFPKQWHSFEQTKGSIFIQNFIRDGNPTIEKKDSNHPPKNPTKFSSILKHSAFYYKQISQWTEKEISIFSKKNSWHMKKLFEYNYSKERWFLNFLIKTIKKKIFLKDFLIRFSCFFNCDFLSLKF
jgi:hypothetical protein